MGQAHRELRSEIALRILVALVVRPPAVVGARVRLGLGLGLGLG